jgi:hypothetical protein
MIEREKITILKPEEYAFIAKVIAELIVDAGIGAPWFVSPKAEF